MSKQRLRELKERLGRRMARAPAKADAFYRFFSDVIVSCPEIKTILAIGVGPDKQGDAWNRFLHKVFPEASFHNLEFDPKLVGRWSNSKNEYMNGITHGDARKIDEVFDEDSFDLIFWNQGPEHILREEWADTFPKLKKVARHVVYLHCPWGCGYDGDVGHLSKSIRKDEFEPHDFKVIYHGIEDSRNAGIMSWKIL